jgi:O-succinylbenzoic acid--CoA ligase
MAMRVVSWRWTAWRRPLVRPVVTSRGVISRRHGWLLSLFDDQGHASVGEAAPEFHASTPRTVAAQLAEALGQPLPEQADALAAWAAQLRAPAWVQHAVEQAALELLALRRSCTVAGLLTAEPVPVPELHVLVNDAEGAAAAVAAGAHAVKLKVGARALADDVRAVAAVRAAVGDHVRIRLDANGAWTLAQARRAILALRPFAPEWLEEPVAGRDLTALAQLRGQGIPLAADESCRDEVDLERVLGLGAADLVVLKPMWVGGLGRTLAMARRASAHGVGVVLTSSIDGPVAEAGVRAVAAACPSLAGVGLDRRVLWLPRRSGPSRHLAGGVRDVTGGVRDVTGGVRDVTGGVRNAIRRQPSASPQRPALPVFTAPLAVACGRRPDAPAVIADDGTALTWRQLAWHVGRTAASWRRMGVQRGDTVAVLASPGAPWAVALHAAIAANVVIAPVDPLAPPASQARALALVSPALVLTEPGLQPPAGSWRSDVLPELGRVQGGEPLASMTQLDLTGSSCGEVPPRNRRQVFARLATSGSTGAPTLCELTLDQCRASFEASARRLGERDDDVWLACLPVHHVGGLSIWLRAAWSAVPVRACRRFDPRVVARWLDGGVASLVSLVPTQLKRLLDHRLAEQGGDRGFSPRVRAILLGGAAAEPALLDRCQATGLPVARTWGMTETASQLATCPPGDYAPGIPLLDGVRARTTGVGTLEVAGAMVRRGWFSTRDLGHVDENRRVHLLGRADDVILRGGENVLPGPIEAAIARHPSVVEVAVVGQPHPELGQVVAAVIVVREPVDDAALSDWLAGHLPRASLPVAWFRSASLPKSPLGKVLRAQVGELVKNPQAVESGTKGSRHLARTESLQINEGVHVTDLGPQRVVGAHDAKSEGDRPGAELAYADLHLQAVTEAHGRAKVGVGVHQRHAPALGIEHIAQAGGGQQLFEGLMAVFEGAGKERDAGAIDVLEADSGGVGELWSGLHGREG